MNGLAPLVVVLPLAAGVTLGVLYFSLLYYAVRLYALQNQILRIVPAMLARFALAGGVFLSAAQLGVRPLLFVLLGFFVGRNIVQFWVQPERRAK